MTVIFAGSTGLGTSSNTSRFIGPILRWFAPNITPEVEKAVVYGIRKCAHTVEYAILALLVWLARRKSQEPPTRGWNWPDALFAIMVAGLYAITDELHQYIGSLYGSSRQGSPWDVLLDTGGATAGMIALRIVGGWFKRW